MSNKSRYPERAKHGFIKEVVLFASVNHMPVKTVARHFSVSPNSVYWAARRMGVVLKSSKADKKPAV
jgi:hypothetical protein